MTRSGNDPRRSAGDRSLDSRPRTGSLAHSSLWDDDETSNGPPEPHRPGGRPVEQLIRPPFRQPPYAPAQVRRQPPVRARRAPAQASRQLPMQARREPQQARREPQQAPRQLPKRARREPPAEVRQPPVQMPRRPTEHPRRRPVDAERRSPTDTNSRAAVQTRGRRTAVGRFVHRHGWRAYSIPLLVALTVLVIVQVGRPFTAAAPPSLLAHALGPTAGVTSTAPTAGLTASTVAGTTVAGPAAGTGADEASGRAANPDAGGAAVAATSTTVSAAAAAPPGGPVAGGSPSPSAAPGPNGNWAALPSAALPSGPTFVAKGLGTWHVVKGTSPVLGSGSRKYTFTIEVEDGTESAPADQDFARAVDAALADPRSWIGSGKFALQRVDTGTPSFRISLTSRMTVREATLCGWQIPYEASCYARDVKRVAINDARWVRGAVSFHGDLASYRVYAVNHEVGHALGYFHLPCATNGGPAPVMMQQSWSTADDDLAPLNPQLIPMDGKVCRSNPYPYPSGAGSPNVVGG